MLVLIDRREEAFSPGCPAQTHPQNNWQVSAIYGVQKLIPNGTDRQLLVR